MYYIDCPETTNIDCVLDGKKELAVQATTITCVSVTSSVLTFSIVAGVFTIEGTWTQTFEAGDTVIIRGSIGATPDFIDNDGVYTIVTSEANKITVLEPVVAEVSAAAGYIDEYATFILHPTKRTGQIVTFIESAATLATFEVSFRPGGYWASKIEKGLPIMQGSGVLSKMYLIQVETAPYLQNVEEDLDIDGVAANDVQKKGTMLMRVFAPKGDPLLAGEVEVAFVQLA
ncbi:MAG TPA: hypothetical protein VMX17_11245 [Candidatus Glassbacteria bacterium]|nr:hypothetical protein [Candidatus Glassbacteria bacterium]